MGKQKRLKSTKRLKTSPTRRGMHCESLESRIFPEHLLSPFFGASLGAGFEAGGLTEERRAFVAAEHTASRTLQGSPGPSGKFPLDNLLNRLERTSTRRPSLESDEATQRR